MKEKYFAAIDLGTNSCRLVIADSKGKTVFKDIERLKMGEGLSQNKRFTDDKMTQTTAHFVKLANIMKNYNIVSSRFVATAGCRNAENAQEFIDEVKDVAGIKLETISEYDEARLTVKGAMSHVLGKSKYVLVCDIGGGSSELTLAMNTERPLIIKSVSIPWGSRTASENFNLATYNEANAKLLQKEVQKYLNDFKKDIGIEELEKDMEFVGVSSTSLRLGAVVKNNGSYDRDALDGERYNIKDIDNAVDSLYKLNAEELRANPYIKKKEDVFIGACVILKTIYDDLKPKEMVTSLRSLKDGIIDELIEKDNSKWQSLQNQRKQSQVGIA